MIKGIGIDLVDKERMKRAVGQWGERFLNRILTPLEFSLCEKKGDRIGSIAARFAAKEAVFKALGTGWGGGVYWKNVEVISGSDGKPGICLYGRAKDLAKGCRVHLSLSHGERTAIAFVVLETEEG